MLALLMSAVMLVSCSKAEPETEPTETEKETTTTTTVEETTEETTAATTGETTAATTTAEPTPTPVPEIKPDPVDAGSVHYDMFMAKVDEIEAFAPGQYRYSIYNYSNYDGATDYCVLTVFGEGEQTSYAIFDGELVVYEGADVREGAVDYSHTYDEIKLMPCLFGTSVTSQQLTDEGIEWNAPVSFVDSIDDGMYFGGLVGISEDGTRALIEAGEPISFDKDTILSMSEGDPLGYADFVIESEFINGDYIQINLVSDTYGRELHLTNHEEADPSRLYLCGESESWFMTNNVLVEVPISPDCVVIDNYINLYAPDDHCYEDREIFGNPIMDSVYWYHMDQSNYLRSNSGWYLAGAALEPVTIQNGESTQVYLGFR